MWKQSALTSPGWKIKRDQDGSFSRKHEIKQIDLIYIRSSFC
jgi:hypothetical protein